MASASDNPQPIAQEEGRNNDGGPEIQKENESLWTYLTSDVDPAQCTGPLAAYSFMTGFMYVTALLNAGVS